MALANWVFRLFFNGLAGEEKGSFQDLPNHAAAPTVASVHEHSLNNTNTIRGSK